MSIFPFERKVLEVFLTDFGLGSTEVAALISKASILERDLDAVGFYVTIKIKDFDMSLFKKSPWTDRVFGKQENGCSIDFLIFKGVNDLLLEGVAMPSDEYQGFKENLQLFETHVSPDGSFDLNDTSSPL